MSAGQLKLRESTRSSAPIPVVFVGATAAVALALTGALIRCLLLAGEYRLPVFGFGLLLTVNLGASMFWGRLVQWRAQNIIMNALAGVSLGLILVSVYDVGFGVQSTLATYLIIGLIFGFFFYILISQKFAHATPIVWVFALTGISALSLLVWDGVDSWSVGLMAKSQKPRVSEESHLIAETAQKSDISKSGWSYHGETGPDMWGNLAPENSACLAGHSQSPVDVPRSAVTWSAQPSFKGGIQRAQLKPNDQFLDLAFLDESNPHMNGNYYLRSGQIHTPSEHTIFGLSYPLELQFYFQSESGKREAVAVFAELGESNPEIDKILSASQRGGSGINEHGLSLDMTRILPADLSGYRYSGSLTSPPCTEGVMWTVVRETVIMSRDQAEALRKIHPMSARPVRQLGKRSFEAGRSQTGH